VPRGAARRAPVELGAAGPPWTMAPPGLPTRGLGPLSFLLKNISFSIIFQEIYTVAPVFCSNYNIALSFGFNLISNP
jgi:hypothetical protein